MSYTFLTTPVEYLKGIGPKRAELLKNELSIYTFGDLLEYFPFRYIDRSRLYKIIEINNDLSYVQICGRLRHIQMVGKGPASRLVATLQDDSGEIELVWFQGIKWIKDKLVSGSEYLVFGKPALFSGRYNIPHPEIDVFNAQASAVSETFQPFYNSSEKLKASGFNSRGFSKVMKILVTSAKGHIPETLPKDITEHFGFISREEALLNIHFPKDQPILAKAESRLKFEELFYIQLRLLRLKLIRISKIQGHPFSHVGEYFNSFYYRNLPFPLTNAQKRVMKEIRADVGSGKQMNRLLQGDVGSGKTMVALMSMLIAIDNGFQACLMAPTEILAFQHYESLNRLLAGLNITIRLLTRSTKSSEKKILYEQLLKGELQIVIGTHALIEETVSFKNLGLVVIDEQHRFGVAQRARLWKKNAILPHVLIMTATPIPRTLAMTLYGDLDYSVIDELPPGRKSIKTYHFYESGHLKVYGFMRQEIKKGRQIYIVYPLIQESETLDLKALMEGYETIIREFPLPEFAVSIVHGQLKSEIKDFEMQRFIRGETQIMVATTVIEVGVDIPNATVIIIENAERFGLSQLHQLRGRVGRGADQSYCILMTKDDLGHDARKRIETMLRTSDGFEIAEEDLRLRGPGDMQGTQQSGILQLRIADLVRDEKLLKYARDIAIRLLEKDPLLEHAENKPLSDQLMHLTSHDTEWGLIS
ncbi:MAG: ATP-dependent DNA helicase RecG [Bacteroidetes bacterium]|nr:ATP-dependent DNA helicase RecG [Bacteroidota bacterium]